MIYIFLIVGFLFLSFSIVRFIKKDNKRAERGRFKDKEGPRKRQRF